MKSDDEEEYKEEFDFNESLFCYAKEKALKLNRKSINKSILNLMWNYTIMNLN